MCFYGAIVEVRWVVGKLGLVCGAAASPCSSWMHLLTCTATSPVLYHSGS